MQVQVRVPYSFQMVASSINEKEISSLQVHLYIAYELNFGLLLLERPFEIKRVLYARSVFQSNRYHFYTFYHYNIIISRKLV